MLGRGVEKNAENSFENDPGLVRQSAPNRPQNSNAKTGSKTRSMVFASIGKSISGYTEDTEVFKAEDTEGSRSSKKYFLATAIRGLDGAGCPAPGAAKP